MDKRGLALAATLTTFLAFTVIAVNAETEPQPETFTGSSTYLQDRADNLAAASRGFARTDSTLELASVTVTSQKGWKALAVAVEAEQAELRAERQAEREAAREAAAQAQTEVSPSASTSNSSTQSVGGSGMDASLDWAALRECESGNTYTKNTGNGYYGAYQFSLSTWQSMGGSGLPSDAPPAEQDARAQALYDVSGAGPWPVCGQLL